MTDMDTLSRKIGDLKHWQTLAWRRIADPAVTTFERREVRNHLKQSDEELRRCLAMMSGRFRFNARPEKTAVNSLANIKFKLLARDEYDPSPGAALD
jgi:hypothetical protein